MIIQPVTRKRLWKPPIGSTVNRSHPMAQSLRACWLFNEGGGALLHDIGPRQATAAQAGTVSPSTWISTPYGYGFDFASNLRYDTAATWENQFLNAWSISVLLRSPLSVASDRLITIHDSGINYRYLFQTKNTSAIQFGGYGSSYPYTSTGVLTANKWHHVVCVAQPGQTDIYVDTVNVKSVSDVYYGTSADGPLSINGLRASGTWYYGRSDFAHIMMWDRALSVEDVMRLYVDPYDHIDPPLSRRYVVVSASEGGGETTGTKTLTGGALLLTSPTKTITGGALLKTEGIFQLTGGSLLLTTGTKSATGGAALLKSLTKILTGGALLQTTGTKTLTGGAELTSESTGTKTLTGGALVSKTGTKTATGGSLLKVTGTKTLTGGAVLSVSGEGFKILSGGALLRTTKTKTITGGGLVALEGTKTLTGGAVLKSTGAKTLTGGCVLSLPGTGVKVLTGGALLKTEADAVLAGGARLATAKTKTITGGARLATDGTKTLTGGAVLAPSTSKVLTGGALLQTTGTKALSGGAYLYNPLAHTLTDMEFSSASRGVAVTSKSRAITFGSLGGS